MDDLELLTLAAKAADLPVEFDSPVNDWYPCGYDDNGDVARWWNPLTDDGDALRLAVKLGMHAVDAFPVPTQALAAECNGDWYAATRRAIVRAAAAIGGA